MNKAAKAAKEIEAKRQQASRLLSVLEMSPDLSAHIILRCNEKTAPDAVRRALRAFTMRARVRAGAALRYVIVQETTADGRDIAAYHVFCNLSAESCRQICVKWDLGPYSIRRADTRERETLPPFIFDTSRTNAGHRLFNASRNIWDSVPCSNEYT